MKLIASAAKDHRVQRAWIARAIGVGVVTAAAGCATPPPAAAPPPPSPAATTATTTKPPKATYPTMAPLEQYLIADRDAEIALARSAAPAKIANEATVYVLTRGGYEKAVEGKNGFACLVDRAWQDNFDDPEFWNPKARAPVCLNAPAVRSILPLQLKRTELALSGLGREQILERVKDALAKKELSPPEMGAMSYMMSKQQYLNDGDTHWHPHLMFYMPGDMNASAWGANLPAGSAVYGGGEDMPGGGRLPSTIFFVPVPAWSDGTVAEMNKHH